LNARTLILAILNFDEATGYEIRKMSTEGPFSYFAEISYGSIYPTLAKLEADGLVISRHEQDPGKPERKVYSITEAGRAAFCEAMTLPPAMDKFKSEFLLVAMSAEFIPTRFVERALDERIAYLESQIAMINNHVTDCDHLGTCWVGDYGKHVMRTDLEYLKSKRSSLLSMAGTRLERPEAAE
jgi:DNA-binding PadR family transcriptional regulator